MINVQFIYMHAIPIAVSNRIVLIWIQQDYLINIVKYLQEPTIQPLIMSKLKIITSVFLILT